MTKDKPEPFSSHEAYFEHANPVARPHLEAIQQRVEQFIPDATRCIAYNMPAFKSDRVFFYFAAFKQHIGVYPPVTDDKQLVEELKPYRNEKGNLAFCLKEPLPVDLIARVAKALHAQYSRK